MSQKKNASALAFLLLASATLCAQEYSFRSFGVTEGLNNLGVRQIYQDRVGFLWVRTENGIYRFDGNRFEAFGSAQGVPASAAIAFGDAPDGSLLVGGAIGLYHLEGNRFEKLRGEFKTISWAQGIQADGRGHTFLGTDSGLVELSSKPGQKGFATRTFARPPGTSNAGAYGVLVESDALWYGCGHELCRIRHGETTVFGRESGLPDRESLTIRRDRQGNLWLREQNFGVFELPSGQTRFRRPDSPTSALSMNAPNVDADGRVLLPSPDGLLIHDERGWQSIGRSSGLRGNVYATFEDRQHTMWLGLEGRGLVQWRGYQEWESYSTSSGLASDLVYEILPQPGGVVWVGTEAGLERGERKSSGFRWTRIAALNGVPVHAVRMAPNGDLWLGTETRGAARLDVRTQTVKWFGDRQGLEGKAAYTLLFDREQRLWAATEDGLFMAVAPYASFSRVRDLNEVLQQAELAMFQAKAAGHNTIRFFSPGLQAAVNTRAAMEEDLRLAIQSGQFVLYYQPQLKNGVVTGAEALVRWNHPEKGILPPGQFIPLAEQTGLIAPLGDWVLEAACRQIGSWAGNPETASVTIAVNVSALQIRQADFVERVLMVLARTSANPNLLKLELTESVLVDDVDQVIAKMTELKRHGLTFSLDDFGTGYSSLSYLRRLPLDELKIDRSFVQNILDDGRGGAIAQTIISLASAMGLSVMAEGVETEEQRDCLARLGCHSYQGFWFSPPVPADQFEMLLPVCETCTVVP